MSSYANTISGLLRKRVEMMDEVPVTRERLAVLSNEIESKALRQVAAGGVKGAPPA